MRALLITSNRLGDAVLTTGAVPFLRAAYPAAEICVACGPLPAPIFEAMPEVTEVWRMAKLPFSGHWRALWRKAVRCRWTHVIDLRGSAFAYTVVAKRRTIMRPDPVRQHRVMHLTKTLGATAPIAPHLSWSSADLAEAQRRMGTNDRWIAIGPTANWIGKQWQAESFGTVAHALIAPDGLFAGANVLVPGAPGEETMAQPMLDMLPREKTIAAFGWPLPVLAAAMAQCELYIGNDSGLMHMAAAVGVPTVGLFGPSRPELYAPWGERTAIVRTRQTIDDFVAAPGYNRHTTGSLMGEITPEAVLETVHKLMDPSK